MKITKQTKYTLVANDEKVVTEDNIKDYVVVVGAMHHAQMPSVENGGSAIGSGILGNAKSAEAVIRDHEERMEAAIVFGEGEKPQHDPVAMYSVDQILNIILGGIDLSTQTRINAISALLRNVEQKKVVEILNALQPVQIRPVPPTDFTV